MSEDVQLSEAELESDEKILGTPGVFTEKDILSISPSAIRQCEDAEELLRLIKASIALNVL